MKQIYTISFLILLIFQSCATYDVSRYTKASPINNKLPALHQVRYLGNPEQFYGGYFIVPYDVYKYRVYSNNLFYFKQYENSVLAKSNVFANHIGGYYDYELWYINRNLIDNEGILINIQPNNEFYEFLNSHLPKAVKQTYVEYFEGKPIQIERTTLFEIEELRYYVWDSSEGGWAVLRKQAPFLAPESVFLDQPTGMVHFHLNKPTVLIDDVNDIFLRYNSYLLEEDTVKYGYIAYKVHHLNHTTKIMPTIISGLTVFTINLFGFPLGKSQFEIELSVSIYDSNENLIKEYFSKAKAKESVALYWGYYIGHQDRPANSKAFSKAYREIIKEINKDIPYLRSKLLN